MQTRRDFFASALALAASNPLPVLAQSKMSRPVFSLGVASGEPEPGGIVLWTRLAAEPAMGGGMPEANVPVRWEVAEDESFGKVVRKGQEMATPMLAHSVHAEVNGLKPDRWYWYRFEAAGQQSPAGRFRTAPAPGAAIERLRLGVASCQQWSQGLFTAYQHMAEEDLDLVLHLGDYIYEKGYKGQVRTEGEAEVFTLTDYRNRHALYKTDPMLQRAHARFPFSVIWDDHEVANNYADYRHELGPEKGQGREAFLERRSSAYQAFYEHLPLRRESLPSGSKMQLYRRLQFGNLARIHLLDTRQYRSDQPCGDGLKPACPDLKTAGQTLLGEAQEKWLDAGLGSSNASWDVLAQQIFVTKQDFHPGPDEFLNMDSWSGYPKARERLAATLAARKRNAVILTGDVHSAWVAQLHREPEEVKSPCLAAEFVTTSISSSGDGSEMTERAERSLAANPQISFFNGRRGYLRCQLTAKSWRSDYRGVDFVSRPGGSIATKGSFVVEPGRLAPQKA